MFLQAISRDRSWSQIARQNQVSIEGPLALRCARGTTLKYLFLHVSVYRWPTYNSNSKMLTSGRREIPDPT